MWTAPWCGGSCLDCVKPSHPSAADRLPLTGLVLQKTYGNRWSLVAQHISGRTGQQCAQRWRHKVRLSLSPCVPLAVLFNAPVRLFPAQLLPWPVSHAGELIRRSIPTSGRKSGPSRRTARSLRWWRSTATSGQISLSSASLPATNASCACSGKWQVTVAPAPVPAHEQRTVGGAVTTVNVVVPTRRRPCSRSQAWHSRHVLSVLCPEAVSAGLGHTCWARPTGCERWCRFTAARCASPKPRSRARSNH